MADLINLKQFRKRKVKSAEQLEARENRIRHGRTRAEKHVEKTTRAQSIRKLDGHKIDPKN